MPELPEVETIRRELLNFRKSIFSERVFCQRLARNIRRPEWIEKKLAGKVLLNIERYGKYLRIALSDDFSLWGHLGMSGQLFFQKEAPEKDPHIHFWVYLKGPQHGYLVFRDVRKFGRLELIKDEKQPPAFIQRLGEDPFFVKTQTLKEKLSSRKSALKILLLDQEILAGIGNIYADESLFLAKIHPLKKGNELSETEILVLLESIRAALNASLERGGTTLKDYRRANGQKGENQKYLKVYGQEGKPCQNCKHSIQKIILAARSTFFCPVCQKK